MTTPRPYWLALATVVSLFALGCGGEAAGRRAADSEDDPDQITAAARNLEGDLDGPRGIEKRVPWTTSRVVGSPEPPPPYRTDRVFPNLKFVNPVLIKPIPGTSRYLVAEQRGKLLSYENKPDAAKTDPLIDVFAEITSIPAESSHQKAGACYGVAFHPKFAENRFVYVCYVMSSKESGKQQPDGSRVSRFQMTDADPPKLDPASEQVVYTWLGDGHNGGCLEFGPDGYLYISTGDGSFPNPPDALLAGQDETRVLSAVLRIDVDKPDGDRPYSIPKDNPLVDVPNARGEKWAYGFRNPWRMTFDPETGDLWLGDVGWELYEMVHYVEKGGNYGWSVVEGKQSVRPELKRGPTPILPPAIDLPHSMAASVTGGYVYRGKQLPDLVGKYVFGDWETRRMWAATWDRGTKTVTKMDELVEPTLRIVCFGETPERELLIMDYDDGTIHQLVKNDAPTDLPPFPTKLSETGLFASLSRERDFAAEGVMRFEINTPMWADGAQARWWLALPGTSSIVWHQNAEPIPGTIFNRTLEFPKDAVLAKTIFIRTPTGMRGRRKIETQILHYNGRVWRGYSYRWNREQDDAELVGADGLEIKIPTDYPNLPGTTVDQTYRFPSRADCVRCHNPWAQHSLAFTIAQINRSHVFENGAMDHQIRAFEHAGILRRNPPDETDIAARAKALDSRDDLRTPAARLEELFKDLPRLTAHESDSFPLSDRVRSYLHANCAHCHQKGGGGTADIDLRFDLDIEQTKVIDVRPMQGTFQIHDARILAPGDPYRSVLFHRIAKLGKGRMPHLGSHVVDGAAVRLVHDWIRQLPTRWTETQWLEQLKRNDEAAALKREAKEVFERRGKLAARIARERISKERQTSGKPALGANDPAPVTDADREAATTRDEQEATERTKDRAKRRAEALDKLLSTTPSAMMLVRAIQMAEFSMPVRQQALDAALAASDPQIRELFELFIPENERPKRLGSVVRTAEILALAGNAKRGRALFFDTPNIQCKNCHRIGEGEPKPGPDLTDVGKRQSKAQILESLLEPSKRIEAKYTTYLLETTTGRVVTGLLVEKNDREHLLRDVKNELIRVPTREVEQFVPQRQSLMPDLQLRDMTKEQAADLLEFLSGLKGP